jgi:hypothetical protein
MRTILEPDRVGWKVRRIERQDRLLTWGNDHHRLARTRRWTDAKIYRKGEAGIHDRGGKRELQDCRLRGRLQFDTRPLTIWRNRAVDRVGERRCREGACGNAGHHGFGGNFHNVALHIGSRYSVLLQAVRAG